MKNEKCFCGYFQDAEAIKENLYPEDEEINVWWTLILMVHGAIAQEKRKNLKLTILTLISVIFAQF